MAETIIGVTGHQEREGLDWEWTRTAVAKVLRDAQPVSWALTSLAVGTDQLFAQEALDQAIDVRAIVPFATYAHCFDGDGLATYEALLAQCAEVEVLERRGSDKAAFLAAGKRVADECSLLIAVWDGEPAAGLGGTADIVEYAIARGRDIIYLDPFARTTTTIRAKAT